MTAEPMRDTIRDGVGLIGTVLGDACVTGCVDVRGLVEVDQGERERPDQIRPT
jgi:hypothetical protein